MEKYPGKELEIFDKAVIFQKYIHWLIKKYIKNKTLEVGAGLGSFTKTYINNVENINLTEIDQGNFDVLKNKFNDQKIKVFSKKIQDIDDMFDTVIYLNVLEHIEKDVDEIDFALSKCKKDGYLVILVPAHQKLYSNFDREIGHFKRYDKNFFKRNYKNAELKKLIYVDAMGYFLYFLNKILFSKESYPSSIKVQIWDKLFTPITFFIDLITGYKFGKNILCIIKKK